MTKSVFTSWRPEHSDGWNKRPVIVNHALHELPLFSREALAALIETYPREHYSLVHMGAHEQKRFWREGDIGDLSGMQVIDAIEQGRMWLNLRQVAQIDQRYRRLTESIYDDIDQKVTGLNTFARSMGILISSPNAQVYYHADLPGQSLWQIAGRKRVYIYPPKEPFLTAHQIEDIAVFEVEVDMPYKAEFDRAAEIIDMEPGMMVHWPLHSPHRVENYDCLNISVTTEHWTQDIKRQQMVNMANGLMRHRFGLQPKSSATTGPGFWSKAVMQAGLRRTKWLKKQRCAKRPIEFQLDKDIPGAIVELTGSN